MMIVVSDGEISYFDKKNLDLALRMLKEMKVTRFAIGVSDILGTCCGILDMSNDQIIRIIQLIQHLIKHIHFYKQYR